MKDQKVLELIEDYVSEDLKRGVRSGEIGRVKVSNRTGLSMYQSREVIRVLRSGIDLDEEDEEDSKQDLVPKIHGVTSEEELSTEEIREHHSNLYQERAEKHQRRRNQEVHFEEGPVAIAFVGDQHIGNAGTDIDRVFEEAEVIKNTPRMYCWQMGDVVDNFIVGRLKDLNIKPTVNVKAQWKLAEEYLEVFEDRLIAMVGGNHGAWTLQQTGIDQRKEITPDGILYDSDEIEATVRVGDTPFRIWARHKWKGNSIYNPTHGQERAAKFQSDDYDVYVGAHDHKGSLFREFIQDEQRKAAVMVGTYKQVDDYAKQAGFPGSDGSTVCALILHEDGYFWGAAQLRAISNYMKEWVG